jgi:uncharacterized protein
MDDSVRLFAVTAWDAPGAEPVRLAVRDAHFSHIERVLDKLCIAGPLKTEAEGFAGSLLIIKARDRAEAQAIFETDPYFKAGVWDRIEIHPFVAAAGEWIGGKVW